MPSRKAFREPFMRSPPALRQRRCSACAIQRNGSCIALIPVLPMQPTESPPWTYRAVVVEDAVGAILPLEPRQHQDLATSSSGLVVGGT